MSQGLQRVLVPAGFSGWFCARCGQACPTIPDDLDAAQTKCPHCRKWTAIYVPPSSAPQPEPPIEPASNRERAGEARKLAAGAEWQRKIPRAERAKDLFAHMRAVIENPDLNPDLTEIEREQYER